MNCDQPRNRHSSAVNAMATLRGYTRGTSTLTRNSLSSSPALDIVSNLEHFAMCSKWARIASRPWVREIRGLAALQMVGLRPRGLREHFDVSETSNPDQRTLLWTRVTGCGSQRIPNVKPGHKASAGLVRKIRWALTQPA